MTLHDRKVKILRTLKNLWKSKSFPSNPSQFRLSSEGGFIFPNALLKNFISDDLNTLADNLKRKSDSEGCAKTTCRTAMRT